MDNNETPIFDPEPDVTGEVDALSILQSQSPGLIERFFDSLRQVDRDTFVVTISHGGRSYAFRDSGPGAVMRLAAEYVNFSPEREANRERARLEEQRQRQASARAAAERQNTLVRSLLGGAA